MNLNTGFLTNKELETYAKIVIDNDLKRPLDTILEYFMRLNKDQGIVFEGLSLPLSVNYNRKAIPFSLKNANGGEFLTKESVDFLRRVSLQNQAITGTNDQSFTISNILAYFLNFYSRYEENFNAFLQITDNVPNDFELLKKYRFFTSLEKLGKYIAANYLNAEIDNGLLNYYTDFESLGRDFVYFGSAEEVEDGLYAILK